MSDTPLPQFIKMLPGFYALEALLLYVDEPQRKCCHDFWIANFERLDRASGSSHNHQAWVGGYRDHITDAMNIGLFLYNTLSGLGKLPFTVSDALLVIFLHDIEKLWKDEPRLVDHLKSKVNRKAFRRDKIAEFGFELTEAHWNAINYIEGEGDDYSNKRRVMNELAAFCHMCDVASARIWHSAPLARDAGP